MDRREFFRKSILGLGAFFLMNKSFAKVVQKAAEGSLGYKNESRFPNKNCQNCKHYKMSEDGESGECVLLPMKKMMKADVVLVDPKGHCNMWAKIS